MSEENQPSVDDLKAQLKEAQARAEQAESERQKILNNKDQILGEYKEFKDKFKGFDETEYNDYLSFKEQRQKNEELDLLAKGEYEKVLAKRMEGREKAWHETESEYKQRVEAAQRAAEEAEMRAQELEAKTRDMTLRQYFKDLTGEDDSFKKDYFQDFFMLQSKHADIDEETGNVYALDEKGKRQIDTDGNFVPFNDYYAKLKVKHGLFWDGGAGSGIKGMGGQGDGLGKDPLKWSHEQKREFIKQHGQQAYAKALANRNK